MRIRPRNALSAFTSAASTVAALALAAGCAGTHEPAPLVPPDVSLAVDHWAGTILTGQRRVAPPPPAPDDCLAVLVTVYYVDRPPSSDLAPIASRARLAVDPGASDPLLPVARLALGARVGSGSVARASADATRASTAEPARAVLLGHLVGALPPDATFALDVVSADTSQRRTAFLVSRDGAGAPSVALAFDGFVARDANARADGPLPGQGNPEVDGAPQAEHERERERERERKSRRRPNVQPGLDDHGGESMDDEPRGDVEPTRAENVLTRQVVLLQDAPGVDGEPLVIEVPSRFDSAVARAFVVTFELRTPRPDDARHVEAVARCAADQEENAALARERGAELAPDEIERGAVAAAHRALVDAKEQRAALVFLAGSNHAPLALDVALCADDALLTELLRTVDGREKEPAAAAAVGWQLERSVLAVLAARLDDGRLAPDLGGLLAQHTGEAGRFPGVLTAVLARTTSRQQFDAALAAENVNFLVTSDPAARVRAFDWLAARGLAPAGFDPLGPREERRAALAAFAAEASARSAAPAAGESGDVPRAAPAAPAPNAAPDASAPREASRRDEGR